MWTAASDHSTVRPGARCFTCFDIAANQQVDEERGRRAAGFLLIAKQLLELIDQMHRRRPLRLFIEPSMAESVAPSGSIVDNLTEAFDVLGVTIEPSIPSPCSTRSAGRKVAKVCQERSPQMLPRHFGGTPGAPATTCRRPDEP